MTEGQRSSLCDFHRTSKVVYQCSMHVERECNWEEDILNMKLQSMTSDPLHSSFSLHYSRSVSIVQTCSATKWRWIIDLCCSVPFSHHPFVSEVAFSWGPLATLQCWKDGSSVHVHLGAFTKPLLQRLPLVQFLVRRTDGHSVTQIGGTGSYSTRKKTEVGLWRVS